MTFTSHGHQIIGTTALPRPDEMRVARCGGAGLCVKCSREASIEMEKLMKNPVVTTPVVMEIPDDTYQQRAMNHVQMLILGRWEKTDEFVDFDLYIVWFVKVLQNWKCLVSTNMPDGMYYEVTYNGDKKETYIDSYKKFDNVAIPD